MTAPEAVIGAEGAARLSVEDVLEAVCAPASSGAGVAAALALALAVACARKAVAVTAAHADAGLKNASELHAIDDRLQVHQHRAVAHAQRDALLFRAYLDTKEPRQAQNLVESGRQFQALVRDVGDELEGLRQGVATSVAGDIEAASALHRAVGQMSAELLREARGERNRSVSCGDASASH